MKKVRQRERQILYDFIVRSKKTKTNEQVWQNRNIAINTENKRVIARGEELGGMSEISDSLGKDFQLQNK